MKYASACAVFHLSCGSRTKCLLDRSHCRLTQRSLLTSSAVETPIRVPRASPVTHQIADSSDAAWHWRGPLVAVMKPDSSAPGAQGYSLAASNHSEGQVETRGPKYGSEPEVVSLTDGSLSSRDLATELLKSPHVRGAARRCTSWSRESWQRQPGGIDNLNSAPPYAAARLCLITDETRCAHRRDRFRGFDLVKSSANQVKGSEKGC